MTTITKTQIKDDLKICVLKLESVEAQIQNTFDYEKKQEYKTELKKIWENINVLLDAYNLRKRAVKE
jgi:hypothetical protein